MFQLTAARRRLAGKSRQSIAVLKNVSTHSRPKAAGTNTSFFKFKVMFQLTAARRRLGRLAKSTALSTRFQLTAARRRLAVLQSDYNANGFSFNSQPPEGGWTNALIKFKHQNCFNSQPPEGGWKDGDQRSFAFWRFNSQPPEGGWGLKLHSSCPCGLFQLTAARRRLARMAGFLSNAETVSTHSRPKAAGASAETLNRQGLHCPVSLRFH